ncbi:MAG: hypothetical protein QM715_15240 [Nibricoccus sp.]
MKRSANIVSLAGALASLLLLSLTGCNSPVTPIETKITPKVITIAKINSKGINPQNVNDWLSPSWQDIETWWRNLPTTQPPREGLEAVVGWEILFDTRGTDSKFRQDLYRAGFSYDLSTRQNLKGLVTKATMTFRCYTLPSGVAPNTLCQPMTGAGGSLVVLAPSATLPTAPLDLAYLGSARSGGALSRGLSYFCDSSGALYQRNGGTRSDFEPDRTGHGQLHGGCDSLR